MTETAETRAWRLRMPGRLSWIGERRQEYERGTGRTKRQKLPRAARVGHGVRVEYSPCINGDPDPGEVVWTWVPYREDPTRGKDRPVVVVGRTGAALAGVPLTSKDKGRDDHVSVGTGAWDDRRRPSFAKVDRLITFLPVDVRREGAILDRGHFDDVVAGLGTYHELVAL